MQDFPFTIRDVASVMNLRIRHRNTVSLDVDCPLCDDHKGKMNLNFQKNVFRCNRCGESGGMLNLYAKAYGVDIKTARKEIIEATGRTDFKREMLHRKDMERTETQITNAVMASDADKHKTYSKLFDMLILADCHKNNLLKRGFTEEQIVENGYKSTPVYGFRNLTKRLIEEGCTVEGVPGFYKDKDGEWTVYFNRKSSGFMIPVRNIYGLITGVQIRLDHPYEGRKYIWLSSVNFEKGTTSGSPVHFVGNPGEKTVFVTEGPLKGDLAHALSGRTFLCVPGVNQSLNLLPVLKEMKNQGTTFVYEAYDMDKLLATVCHGDYSEKCRECPCINKDWKHEKIPCSKKQIKRDNIDKACNKLAQICKEVGLTGKTLTWDTDAEGNWAENVKGVDDYLVSLQQKKLEE